MSKRIIALICLFAMLLGFVPGTVTTANAATDQYKVGYSKKNINPIIQNEHTGDLGVPATYLKDGVATEYTDIANKVMTKIHTGTDTETYAEIPIISVPLRGYGNQTGRLATCLTDDNGDGLITVDDGIFATATYVTDASGNSVVYLTADFIYANSDLLQEVRTRVMNAIKAKDSNTRLAASQIILSCSHTHSAPAVDDMYAAYTEWLEASNYDISYAAGSEDTPDTLYGAYWEYIVSQLTAAAVEAYEDRSAADMSKGEIDASDAMKEMGYTYTSGSNAGEGFMMNSTRHYNVTQTRIKVRDNWFGNDTEEILGVYQYNTGDNFGTTPTTLGTRIEDTSEQESGLGYTIRVYDEYQVSHVTESNDKLYVLKFAREEGEPVVLINWRAHASMNGTSSLTNLSSDYVNALRFYLENAGYCVGFWQGAAGNINGSSRIPEEYTFGATAETSVGYMSIRLDEVKVPWNTDPAAGTFYYDYYAALSGYSNEFYRSALYGCLMGKIAVTCLTDHMTGTLDMGDIRVLALTDAADSYAISADWKTAANNWYADVTAGTTITYPYITTVNGTNYAINSEYHGNKLRTIANTSGWSSTERLMEINVIVMGENVALVTGAGELFDYYDADGATDAASNDWLELNEVLGEKYGTAFVLSYTNSGSVYLPNTIAYDFVTEKDADVASGSYEVNTTNYAQGTGESIIQMYKTLLEIVLDDSKFLVKECSACGKEVVWTPVYDIMETTDYTTGHYYLAEDVNADSKNSQMRIGINTLDRTSTNAQSYYNNHAETVCIDLNGNSFYNSSYCFRVEKFSSLNIFDTVGGGKIQGSTSDNNSEGGTYHVRRWANISLYGGTHAYMQTPGSRYNGTGWGGVMYLMGTLNLYDGARIEGADIVSSTYSSSKTMGGGAVWVYSTGRINAYGGEITSGSVCDGAYGPCVYSEAYSGRVWIYGNARIDDIYFDTYIYNQTTTNTDGTTKTSYYIAQNKNSVNIGNAFTGELGVSFNETRNPAITENFAIGGATGASIDGAKITINHSNAAGAFVSGNYLYVKAVGENDVAVLNTATGATTYTDLKEAVNAASGQTVKLIGNVTADTTLTTDATIDLAGHSITGVLNTASGNSIKLMDSATDDFDVSDGNYAKVKITDANKNQIAAVTAETSANGDGYLMITEDDGASFHRVQVKINSMSLRPAKAGLYYSSSFAGDQMVADLISANENDVDFGVALSISAIPDATNLNTRCLYSKFTDFKAGVGANDSASNSTLLVNVINTDRSNLLNNEYAKMKIYGRAFIALPNGQYFFGKAVARSLRQQVEATDAAWDQLNYAQENALLELYNTFGAGTATFMNKWNLPNIIEEQQKDRSVLKILEVGNSHGLDSTNLLAKIIEKETGKKVIIGALYYSGCNLKQHADFMTNEKAVYSYYKNATFTDGVDGINTDGSWHITKNTVAQTALEDEDWDIITLQQMNYRGGIDVQYVPSQFNTVLKYIKENKKNPDNEPIMMWHMVWANPDETTLVETTSDANWVSNHSPFYDENGNYDMDILYENIVRCTQKYIVGSGNFVGVIPAATAIQYAKNNLTRPQTELYRDYTHLSDYGRLIAAYVWYAKIFGIDSISDIAVTEIPSNLHHENSNYPSDLKITEDMKAYLIEAVNWALKNPYSVG